MSTYLAQSTSTCTEFVHTSLPAPAACRGREEGARIRVQGTSPTVEDELEEASGVKVRGCESDEKTRKKKTRRKDRGKEQTLVHRLILTAYDVAAASDGWA